MSPVVSLPRFLCAAAPFSRLRHQGSPGIIPPPVPACRKAVSLMPASPSSASEPSFEDAMERLEEIVSAMEGERMPLEEMVKSYAEGAQLLKICRQRIEVARQRVELITADLDGTGKAALADFDADSAEAAPESPTKPRTTTARRPSPAKPSSDDDGDDIRLF
jgi:exodeoxyribonuclease VII small subunit